MQTRKKLFSFTVYLIIYIISFIRCTKEERPYKTTIKEYTSGNDENNKDKKNKKNKWKFWKRIKRKNDDKIIRSNEISPTDEDLDIDPELTKLYDDQITEDNEEGGEENENKKEPENSITQGEKKIFTLINSLDSTQEGKDHQKKINEIKEAINKYVDEITDIMEFAILFKKFLTKYFDKIELKIFKWDGDNMNIYKPIAKYFKEKLSSQIQKNDELLKKFKVEFNRELIYFKNEIKELEKYSKEKADQEDVLGCYFYFLASIDSQKKKIQNSDILVNIIILENLLILNKKKITNIPEEMTIGENTILKKKYEKTQEQYFGSTNQLMFKLSKREF